MNRKGRFIRRALLALVVLGAMPLLLSGCVVIVSDDATQVEVIGSVQISTTGCYSDDYSGLGGPSGTCANGNSASPVFFPGFSVLIAYRVPSTAVAPATFSDTLGNDYSQDSGYSSQLTALLPPPAGQKWVGYRSTPIFAGGPGANFTVEPQFGLGQGDDGSPFQGPFLYRTVTGYTDVSGPVDCGTSATTLNPPTPSFNHTICVDSPDPGTVGTNKSVATKDLGIVGDSTTGASVGGEGTASFTAKYAGAADPAASFTLTASTNVPGGTATPSQPTLTPQSDSSTPVSVRVTVPLDTGPGNYQVTLRAALANGQVRQRTMTFPVRLGAPVLSTAPFITGTGQVGQDLVCSLGTWHNSTPRFAIQWRSDGKAILGAVHPHHIVRGTEAGHQLTCAVTAINSAGQETAVTPPIRIGRGAAPSLRLAGVPIRCSPPRFNAHAIARGKTPIQSLFITLDGRRLPVSSADPRSLAGGSAAARGAAVGAPAGAPGQDPIRGIVTSPVQAFALRPGIHFVRATARNAGGTTSVVARVWRCSRR